MRSRGRKAHPFEGFRERELPSHTSWRAETILNVSQLMAGPGSLDSAPERGILAARPGAHDRDRGAGPDLTVSLRERRGCRTAGGWVMDPFRRRCRGRYPFRHSEHCPGVEWCVCG